MNLAKFKKAGKTLWFLTLLIQKESTETKIKNLFIYLTKNNTYIEHESSMKSAIFKESSKPRL